MPVLGRHASEGLPAVVGAFQDEGSRRAAVDASLRERRVQLRRPDMAVTWGGCMAVACEPGTFAAAPRQEELGAYGELPLDSFGAVLRLRAAEVPGPRQAVLTRKVSRMREYVGGTPRWGRCGNGGWLSSRPGSVLWRGGWPVPLPPRGLRGGA